MLDGLDIRQLRIEDLRSLFAIVSQDTVLFHDTVSSNIAYGRPELVILTLLPLRPLRMRMDLSRKCQGDTTPLLVREEWNSRVVKDSG